MKHLYHLFSFLCLLCCSFLAMGQELTVSGKVTSDVEGETLPGVNILVSGTSTGTVTDVDGNYRITVPSPTATLVFSFIGYENQSVSVNGRSVIDVVLAPSISQLSEVVVTAFGIEQERKALAYSAQEVGGEELQQSKEVNVVDAINSKVAGVQVVRQGGSAGAGTSIVIRGNSSLLGNNQPLFVVDGVPINNSYRSSQGNSTGVDPSNRAIDINPDDIESLTVLKGPSATALYGIQAANGVIVITTKKGSRTAGTRVNFTSTASVDVIMNYFPQQDIYAQGDDNIFSGGITFSHFGPPVSTLRFDGSDDNPKNERGFIVDMNDPSAIATERVPAYDNQKSFYENGSTFDNHLSISSGNEKGSYYLSAGHLTQNGIIPNNEFNRTSLKLTAETSVNDKLRVSGSATYTRSTSTRFGRGDNFSDAIQGTLRTPLTFDNSAGYVLPNGEQRNWRLIPGRPYSFGPDNPFWVINKNPYTDEVNRLIGYVQANYQMLPWLNVMYRLGTDISTDKRNQVWAKGSKGGDAVGTSGISGRLLEDTYTDRLLNSDLFVTASKQLTDDLDLSFMIGHNYFESNNERQYFTGYNFAVPGLYTITNTQEDITQIDNTFRKKTTAAFSRLNVNYLGTLFLELSGRNEWSSTLPADNNSFFYGSANLGFVFTELLNNNEDIFTFGKLRASYAVVGNDAPIYRTQTFFVNGGASTRFGGGVNFPINGIGGFQLSNAAGNGNLKPETNTTIELGTDLRFLNNRLGIDFTWYRALSTDQIIPVTVAASTGFTSQIINSGEIENTGIEIMLTGTPIKNSDFTWDFQVNFSRNRNFVKELPLDNIIDPLYSSRLQRAQIPGEQYGLFYGNAFKRNEEGELLIDESGFPQLASEQQIIGNPNPDWLMGIRNNLRYKDLSLSFLWDVRHGGDVANVTGHWMDAQGVAEHSEDRNHAVIFDGVVEASGQPNTKVVILDQDYYSSTPGNRDIAERWIEDGSWFRLRDVSLTYKFPKTLADNIGLQNLSLTAYGRNIWLITNYTGMDPETNLFGPNSGQGIDAFVTPNTRSFGLTLNVAF